MLKSLLRNWKTSSAGALTIATAIIHLFFTANRGEGDWTLAIGQILVGIGLLAAGDSAASVQAHADSQAAIKDLQSQVTATTAAVVTGDTSILAKSNAGQPPTKDPESKP